MIKAVIFDCFGVLTTDGWLKFLDTYLPEGDTRTSAAGLNKQVDAGKITYEEFAKKVSAIANVDEKILHDTIAKELEKNTLIFDYIRTLKPDYKLGILSNVANPNWFNEFFFDEELGLFDDILLSVNVGMIKPDPEFFRLAADNLGVKMHEVVFVDDREPNIDAARRLGMKGLLYKNFPQMKSELEELLAVSDN